MKTIIKIKTWVCPECDYHQDFDPDNAELMAIHFQGVEVGHCPACYTGKNTTKVKSKVKMQKETNPDKKCKMTIIGEEDIETEIEEKDKTVEKEHKEKRLFGASPKMSNKEKTEYRNKRKQDIKEAIANAKKYEDNH